jgi:exonuclease III
MKVVSLNMRGWGGSAKRRRLSSFLQQGKFDVCFLQETKKSSIEDFLIYNLWGHKDVRWVAKDPIGLSGGLLILWNSNCFNLINSFYGDGFLGITVDRDGEYFNFINIYSPCSLAGKKKLWEDLLMVKQHSGGGEWCLGGDFNAILRSSERKGSSAESRQGERLSFLRFVEEMAVIDVPVLGKKFTWFSSDGKSMSRIDRFLLSDGFIAKFSVSGQWIGDRDISDHCPIWLIVAEENWGPKPFRVINGWFDHPDFYSFVESRWKSFDVRGKKAYVLKEKFRLLKECLRKWNKEVYGFIDLNIEKTVKELNELEGLLEGNDGNFDPTIRKYLNNDFWNQLHLKENLLKQKSRMKWVQEGDSNSRYFHESIKSRRRKNQLVALKDGDQWIQGVDEVKGFVKNFFELNFNERRKNRPNLNGIHFRSLSVEDNLLLMKAFTVEEVREVIWSSDGDKSPGPDGFNFKFLKVCWDIVKDDIMNFLHEFFVSATLPKAFTASFLTLIPKKDHPQTLSEYRPICLVTSMYKILSKILAGRLKQVLGKLISNVQSAFLPNRQILDGVMIVNELIDLAKRRKDKCLLFKVDFERAYDTVNWQFLDYMMRRMGFVEGWRKWISACVFNSSMSVLVNGSPTSDFNVGKGLRQGDPLSPFLFLIVVEGLSGLMRKAAENNLFHGYKVSDNIMFHSLQFADDTILVGEGNWDNLWTIKTILRSFEMVSGLKVNFFKSKLYGINIKENFLRASSSFLHCAVESIPFRFLGIPVGANPRRRATWIPIIESMRNRLNNWNGRMLSIRGRVTLINSVLSSLPLYFFSFYKAPSCVLKELVTIQRNFL